MRPALSIRMVDGCRTRRVAELLIIIWILALADLFFTLWAQCFTSFTEINPLASALLEHNRFYGVIALKVALTGLGTAIFWRLRRNWRAEAALWMVTLVYIGLTFRWSQYTTQVLAMSAGSP